MFQLSIVEHKEKQRKYHVVAVDTIVAINVAINVFSVGYRHISDRSSPERGITLSGLQARTMMKDHAKAQLISCQARVTNGWCRVPGMGPKTKLRSGEGRRGSSP